MARVYSTLVGWLALFSCICLTWVASAQPPYITGVVDDNESIPIEMPRLPGNWQRSVVWLAPEGSAVKEGDLIVRLDRGDLVEQEEQARIQLEEQNLSDESQIAEHELAVLDAETELLQAKTQMAIAKIDAEVPIEAITELDWENAQLAYQNAINRVEQAQANLESSRERLERLMPVIDTRQSNGKANWERIRNALDVVDIYASRSGIMIYGENPQTGIKIFPGENLTPGTSIATIANQNQLQFVFWVHDIDRLSFQEDMTLIVTPDAIPTESVEATVQFISNYAIERQTWSSSGYFKLIAKPTQTLPDGYLPGMAVVAEIKS